MTILVLPGFSVRNRIWLEEAGKTLSKKYQCVLHEWRHWFTGDKKDFSLEKETLSIKDKIKNCKQLFLLAKSIGTYVGANLISKEKGKDFRRVVFCGVPLNDLSLFAQKKLSKNLSKFDPSRFLIIQNDLDPHGTYNQVESFAGQIGKNFRIIKMQASDHDYFYFDLIEKEFFDTGLL